MPDMQDFANVNLNDIFSQIFGSAAGGGGVFGGFPFGNMGEQQGPPDLLSPQKGKDVTVECRLKFMEAVNGCSRQVKIQRFDECKECDSSGMKPGTVPTKCGDCDGTGMLRAHQGFMVLQQTCYRCNGTGQSFDPCIKCSGSGLQSSQVQIDVNIPAGVDEGTRVRIAHQGHAGRNHGGRGSAWILTR